MNRVLAIENLRLQRREKILFQDVSCQIPGGQVVGVLGPNGSGKTSLLRTLAGIFPPSSGTIRWSEEAILSRDRRTFSQLVGYLPQQISVSFEYTLEEAVRMGCYAWGEPPAEERMEEVLKLFDLLPLRYSPVTQLSGGEAQRAFLARLWLTKTQIWLLDEPFTHLDIRHQLQLAHLLREEARKGRCILTSLHDLALAQQICDSFLLLWHNRFVAYGDAEQLLHSQLLHEVFGIQRSETNAAAFSLLPTAREQS